MLENKHASSKKRPWRWFQPDYIANSVADIDFGYLAQKGIKAVYIDLDGTVVARGNYDVSSNISEALKNQPLDIYIATNRPKSRDLKNLREHLNANGVVHPRGFYGKPFPRYYTASLRARNLSPHEAVMIGDRYIQDILGANSARLHTLLVRKLDKPTNWFDALLSSTEALRTNLLAKRYRHIR